MATPSSPLASVLKKSLTVAAGYNEMLWWTEAAKKLHEEYAKLVKLHDSIQQELKTEWKDLSKDFDELAAKMQKLENAKVGTGDEERKKYTKLVSDYILEAGELAKRVGQKKTSDEAAKREADILKKKQQAEADRRDELSSDYSKASKMLEDVLAYSRENDVNMDRDFSQAKEWIKWRDSGAISVKQMESIINGWEKVKGKVEPWSKQKAKNKADEDERQKTQAASKKAQEDRQKEIQQKQASEEAERKEKVGPLRKLLQSVLSDTKSEQTEFAKLDAQLEGYAKEYAKDKKFEAYGKRVSDLRKQITNDGRSTLSADTPTLTAVVKSLEGYEAGLEKMDVKDLEWLNRELPKVEKRVEDFEALRTGADGYGDQALALDPKLITKMTLNTKATGYVFTADLGTAEKYKKDMIGILAGMRAGRTSPNGKANHIHVGGDANNNVIFDRHGPGGAVRILGFVDGHMDKSMPPTVRSEAARVEDRASSADFAAVEVDVKARTFTAV
jgi:hypothetical protein